MNAKKHQQSEISLRSSDADRDEIEVRWSNDEDSFVNHCDISEASQLDMLP